LGKPSRSELAGFDWGDVLGNFSDFGDVIGGDPFLSNNETSSWPQSTPGVGGLALTILNALDDGWQNEFATALSEWDNGDPDTLTLTTKQVEVDHYCTQVDGVMKVCNNNFGNTDWVGINEILQSSRGIIVSSVAKMNEYFLSNADEDERQYTMCHEIGHGFGLPHTDENPDNSDLGNCLDYTRRPQNNLHPGQANFLRLKTLYGVVGQNRRRTLRSSSSFPVWTEQLREDYQQAITELEQVRHSDDELSRSHWRCLMEHDRGAHYSRKLGNGYEVIVKYLYPR